MLTRQEYGAIKEDLEMGMFQDREEEHEMRQSLREYEEWKEHCSEVRAEWEQEDARFGSFWGQYA